MWEDNEFKGVIVYGLGASPQIGKPYNLKQGQICELVRVALKTHTNPVSQMLALTFKELKKVSKELKLIVSYADMAENHHGGIYQATNWIYEGIKTQGEVCSFVINGKKTHLKTVSDQLSRKGLAATFSNIRKHIDPKAEKIIAKGKHKYLMPLNKNLKKELQKLHKPYPKK